jgi:hypothetical protein
VGQRYPEYSANYFPKETRFLGALIFAGIVSGYYLINGRYKTIYSRLKIKYVEPPKDMAFNNSSLIILFIKLWFIAINGTVQKP